MASFNAPAGALDVQFGRPSYLNPPQTWVVQLTSSYGGAGTGYSWTELRLDPDSGAYVAPGIPLTGNLAFEATGDTALESGDICLMAIDRDQKGYVLWTSGAGVGSGSGSGGDTGTAPEYQDECLNGYLVRNRATLSSSDGLTQTDYEFEQSYGIRCNQANGGSGSGGSGSGGGGSGSGGSAAGPVPLEVVENVCVKLGFWVSVTSGIYDVTYDDDLISANGSGITINLPSVGGGSGAGADAFTVKNEGSSSVDVDGNGAMIDGSGTVTLSQYQAITVVVDATGLNWSIIAKVA